MIWIAWLIAIIVFAASTTGLAYLSGVWIRRNSWSVWLAVLMCVPIALIWPVAILAFVHHMIAGYRPLDPSAVTDGPAYLAMSALMTGTMLFVPGLFLACAGALLGWRPDLPRKEYSN